MLRLKKRTLLTLVTITILLIAKPSILLTSKKIIFEIIAFPVRKIYGLKHIIRSRTEYERENFFIKEKAALLALEINRVSELGKENERLRRLLDFKKRTPYRSTAAEVVGRVPATWSKVVLINKGTKHGIKRRMAVCTTFGLIGTVMECGPLTSKVMLITDPNSRIGVILEDSRQLGVLVGTVNGGLKVIYLGMDSQIEIGEKLLTSGLGGVFPEHMPVGSVVTVRKDEVKLYKYAIISPDQDLNSLEEVLCIE